MDKKIYAVRRENTRLLLQQSESRTAFLEATGIKNPQLSHLIGNNHKDNIGDKIARRIEKGCHKPQGWLDIDYTVDAPLDSELDLEIVLDCVRELNTALENNGIPISNVDKDAYGELLRHTIIHAAPIGRVTTAQVESTLSLTRLSVVAD